MIFSFARQTMLCLMHKAHSSAHENHQSWYLAMISESESISSNYKAFCFLCGCYFSTLKNIKITQQLEPIMRWILSIIIAGWAGAKFYRLSVIASHDVFTKSAFSLLLFMILLTVTALAYSACAISFFNKKHSIFAGGLIVTLISNLLFFTLTQIDIYVLNVHTYESVR